MRCELLFARLKLSSKMQVEISLNAAAVYLQCNGFIILQGCSSASPIAALVVAPVNSNDDSSSDEDSSRVF